MIIDTHTHTFPDEIAQKAIKKLEGLNDVAHAIGDGTKAGLLKSMDECLIDISIVAPVATNPNVHSINVRSLSVRDERLCYLGAMHPDCEYFKEEIAFLKENGFKGVKMHPDFQDYLVDCERVFPIYHELEKNDMILLLHAGEDISFPNSLKSTVSGILNVRENFPDLKIVAAHLGAFSEWDNVIKYYPGKNIYIDTAFCAGKMPFEKFAEVIKAVGADFVMTASDWPWLEQNKSADFVKKLQISDEDKEKILYKNAKKLFSL